MARISLRAYNRDIEVMIDKNQIDEAFAHCRYILELYPKHIDTYRLMGKALLEAQRFGDASDVFHRVLSSVPDDFIAHLGMSIIREDESNLDAAIWHMERSFEVQPSNAAVQVELRRLYGLRDGVTPQKIQLTRGALARMSAKSNLHSQSIAELRSALSSDPQRPDLQVVLAEMYLQTGSRMEAIETCNALINKLPYCLTANRILAEVLPETERADQAHEYKTRMGELDPYYLQLSAVAPTLEQVPDGAVTIERFEYTGETFETEDSDQPAWAASLGVDLEDEKSLPDEPTPDWIDGEVPEGEAESAIEIEDPVVSEDLEMASDEGAEEALEDIPDWISDTEEAGEEAAPITESETAFEADEVVEEVEIFPSQADAVQEADEVPDWMREEAEPEEQDDAGSIPGIAAAAGAAALGAAIAGQDEENGETEPDAEPAAEEVFPDEVVAEPLPDWMAAEEPGEVEADEPGSVAEDDLVESEPLVASDDTEEQDDKGSIPGIAAAAGAAVLDAAVAGQDDDEGEVEPDAEPAAEEIIPDEGVAKPLPDWMAAVETEGDPLIAEEPGEVEAGETGSEAEDDQVESEHIDASAEPEDAQEKPDWMGEAGEADKSDAPDWLKDAMEGTDEEQEPLSEAASIAAGAAILSDDDDLEPVADTEIDFEVETPSTPDLESEPGEDVAVLDEPAGELMLEDDIDGDLLAEGEGDDSDQEISEEVDLAAGGAALAGAAVAGAALGASMDDEDEMSPDLVDEAALSVEDDLSHLQSESEVTDTVEEDIPEWLQDLGEDLPAGEEADQPAVIFEDQPADEESTAAEDLDASVEDVQVEDLQETPTPDDEELIPEELSAQQDELPEESDFPESIPDWLSEVSPEEIPEEVAEAEAELDIVRAEIPIWLRKMEDQHKAEMEAAHDVDSVEELEIEGDFTELSGEDVPSWLMSAMEPELQADVDETPAVEDISEVFAADEPVGIDELGLGSTIVEEPESEEAEDLAPAEIEDELVAQESTPETLIETDEPSIEVLEEGVEQADDQFEPELEAELESEDITEEIDPDEVLETDLEEEDDERIGVPGLAAAGAAGIAAAHLLDEEDTQPIAVSDEAEPTGVIELADIPEEPIEAVEVESQLLEPDDEPEEETVAEPIESIASVVEMLEEADDTAEQIVETEGEPTPPTEAEIPGLAAEAPLSGEDEDAAMAWLESLAAKQGAAEEELLTPADERLEEPPDWVQEEASEEDITAVDEIDEQRDEALTAAALAGVTAGILAGDEGSEEEPEEAQPEDEPLDEEPSEWVPEVIAGEEPVPEVETEPSSDETGLELEQLGIDEEPDLVKELAAAADVDLEQVETEEITAEVDADQAATEEVSEEIPGWLSGLAEEQEAIAETEDVEWSPDMLTEEVDESIAPAEVEITEKIDLNAASLSQLEKIPGVGFIYAQNIVNHRAASGSFTDLEQLNEVEGFTPEMVADMEEFLTVEVVADVSASESDIPEIQDAWDDIAAGNIDQAVEKYMDLINQDQHLDEVIRDLQSAVNKYPSDSGLYQCLGDAYMHSNMLQEALDAYNRAEDLI